VRAVNVTSLAAIETTSQVDGLPDVNASAAEAQQSRLQVRAGACGEGALCSYWIDFMGDRADRAL
jgi:hypothetical protein